MTRAGNSRRPGSNPGLQPRRMPHLVWPAAAIALLFVFWKLLPAVLGTFKALFPRSARRTLIVGALDGLLVVYALSLVVLVLGLVLLIGVVVRSRGSLQRRPWQARLLLLDVSLLIGLAGLEGAAAVWMGWLHRDPPLPNVKAGPGDGPLRMLVIGESSAQGQPYHPWLSVGQIIGWQLEKVFPGRSIQVDMQAEGGATLERVHQKLARVRYHPDAVLLFCGHNEFQARWAWYRSPSYYADESSSSDWLLGLALRISPACRLVQETLDRRQVGAIPLDRVTRPLVDRPTFTSKERAALLADFRRRVKAIAVYCESMNILPIVIIPGSNDGDYEPSRSALPASASSEAREVFAHAFLRLRALEQTEPGEAIAGYRRLLEQGPGFAETHFRLARLLEAAGQWDEARAHYVQARECDGMPMRCPEEFRQAYRDMAREHPSIVLVDSTGVLGPLSPHGILDHHLYHDAQHPTFLGYLALAQAVLDLLHERQAFGWMASAAAPRIDPDDCARHFQLDKGKWVKVCERSAWFYDVTAYTRYDPSDRLKHAEDYKQAIEEMESGKTAEGSGIDGLGVHQALAH